MKIPLSRPQLDRRVGEYVAESLRSEHLQGNGPFTQRCHRWLAEHVGGTPFLTHSCTAALEMAMLLAEVEPGDEVVMPSFTFVSTASSVVACGGTPVFIDVRDDTCNIDEHLIEEAITPRTKAIVAVHYAGVCCEMDTIGRIAKQHALTVVEDAAQALCSTYKGQPAGTLSRLACFSFHETKNVISGEGGSLIVNDGSLVDRASVIRDKGTNRERFLSGEVDKYTWVDKGSSYLPSDVIAAILLAQLEAATDLIDARMQLWDRYHAAFDSLETAGDLKRPTVPVECGHNAHLYYLRFEDQRMRDQILSQLKRSEVGAAFHYVPLHSSPAGERFGRMVGELSVTDSVASTLLRLPIYPSLGSGVDRVIELVCRYFDG